MRQIAPLVRHLDRVARARPAIPRNVTGFLAIPTHNLLPIPTHPWDEAVAIRSVRAEHVVRAKEGTPLVFSGMSQIALTRLRRVTRGETALEAASVATSPSPL